MNNIANMSERGFIQINMHKSGFMDVIILPKNYIEAWVTSNRILSIKIILFLHLDRSSHYWRVV